MGADLPPEAWAAALAALPLMGPARLLAVLRRWPPEDAWAALGAGLALSDPGVARACAPKPADVNARWVAATRTIEPPRLWDRCLRLGVHVGLLGAPGYPGELAEDIEAPAVLFWLGRLDVLASAPRVAVVGTRAASETGRAVATALGHDLARAGVVVVSGLAEGIDGAAHRGALGQGAPPVGVVGSGLDVVYPRCHAGLWAQVGAEGLLLSEAPPGERPSPWRFPARNRIIAALGDILVVVESRATGGSMHTVREAEARNRTVMAVPGSVRNKAAEGTNQLLHEGCGPARDAVDVLVALGFEAPRAGAPRGETRPAPSAEDRAVLAVLLDDPLTVEHLARLSDRSVLDAALSLARLEAAGWVGRQGSWWQRIDAPA